MTDSIININGDNIQTLEILFITTLISLAPSLVVMMTFLHISFALIFIENNPMHLSR